MNKHGPVSQWNKKKKKKKKKKKNRHHGKSQTSVRKNSVFESAEKDKQFSVLHLFFNTMFPRGNVPDVEVDDFPFAIFLCNINTSPFF